MNNDHQEPETRNDYGSDRRSREMPDRRDSTADRRDAVQDERDEAREDDRPLYRKFSLDHVPEQFHFPVPTRFTIQDLNDMLLWAVDNGSSDIDLINGEAPWVQVQGRRYPVGMRGIEHSEMRLLADKVYRGAAASRLAFGKSVNCSHEIVLSRADGSVNRDDRQRFRVNMTAIQVMGQDAVNMTFRALPKIPPTFEQLKVESEIVDNFRQPNGLSVVSGPTGSGKSTLIAAGIHDDLRDPDSHRKWVTIESPIEFVYDHIERKSAFITQSEVPRHLESFEAGVEEAMRRKPEAGLVGECKDVETVTTCLDMASTGHQVVTTTHATDVPQTIRRMVTFFPREERESRCLQMAESLRMIVVQILVPTLDGKRRACREILVFDAIMRERLMETPIEQWPLEVKSMVRQKGQPMIDPIVNLWREKLISPLIWQQYERQA